MGIFEQHDSIEAPVLHWCLKILQYYKFEVYLFQACQRVREKKKNAESFKKERFLAEKQNEKKNAMKKRTKKKNVFLTRVQRNFGGFTPFSSSNG